MRKYDIYWRQQDIVDVKKLQELEITVVGCGGIGSPTILALSKMGVENLSVFDNDTVESHNIPNQLLLVDDIGNLKIESIQRVVKLLTDADITAYNEKFINQKLSELTIVGTDTMKSRKDVFLAFMEQAGSRYLIDARMAGQYFNIFFVDKKNKDAVDKYKTTIVRDEEASQEKCTEKAIIFNTFGIASFICNIVKRIVNDEEIEFKFVFDYSSWLFEVFELQNFKPIIPKDGLYVEETT